VECSVATLLKEIMFSSRTFQENSSMSLCTDNRVSANVLQKLTRNESVGNIPTMAALAAQNRSSLVAQCSTPAKEEKVG
jgi:hypothetical protein